MSKQMRRYIKSDVITFSKSTDTYGLLANTTMRDAGIEVNRRKVASTENLYHALKFPDHHDLQEELLFRTNSMDSKALARKNNSLVRPDWIKGISFVAMRYVIGVKLSQNLFASSLLDSSKGKALVELSYKDTFWGAKPVGRELVGHNYLGRLWMEVRKVLEDGPWHSDVKEREDFLWDIKGLHKLSLFGEKLEPIIIPDWTMPSVVFPSSLPKGASIMDRAVEQARLKREYVESKKDDDPFMFFYSTSFMAGLEGKATSGVTPTFEKETIMHHGEFPFKSKKSDGEAVPCFKIMIDYASFITQEMLDELIEYRYSDSCKDEYVDDLDKVIEAVEKIFLEDMHEPVSEVPQEFRNGVVYCYAKTIEDGFANRWSGGPSETYDPSFLDCIPFVIDVDDPEKMQIAYADLERHIEDVPGDIVYDFIDYSGRLQSVNPSRYPEEKQERLFKTIDQVNDFIAKASLLSKDFATTGPGV